jgi:phosphoenolpyruvate synthase/pyruvate phosphate dikinase
MATIKTISDLANADYRLAGGKATSLSELTKAGMPVPRGFVILSPVFESFLDESDIGGLINTTLRSVDYDSTSSIEKASQKIAKLFLIAEIPKETASTIEAAFRALKCDRVAIRSSATAEDSADAAWAGQLESYINTTEKDILVNVKRCWASLFTPRAILYRHQKGLLKQTISMAVIVQKMVNGEESGIAFSAHPITQNLDQIVIEAGFGLGETMVSGQITPDNYVLEKHPIRIIEKNLYAQTQGLYSARDGGNEWRNIPKSDKKQVLSNEKIIELSKIVLDIERHYGLPCDIEWAKKNDRFYILQSRPITTLQSVNTLKTFNRDNYILSFWARGISIFLADINTIGYKRLEILTVIDDGVFKQYFTKKAFNQALDDGLKFYSDKNSFDIFQKDLLGFAERFENFMKERIRGKSSISREMVTKFIDYAVKFLAAYDQMNFESTDKAYSKQASNPIIKTNLEKVAKFKDVIRASLNMIFFDPDGYFSQCFSVLSKQFNIEKSVFENLTHKEILELFDGKKPNVQTVLRRQTAYVQNCDMSIFEDEAAKEIIQEFKEVAEASEIIYGQGASKGRISGIVKIIPVDYSDLSQINAEIEKMKKGEILVAETTAPELLVACNKARAIITDMGGLMSHAAIVSREFNIPCVVATKNASKILKDGDKVEVDGDSGIVRVLKK